MHGQVQKWGNSLGIRIPKTLAKKMNLQSGSHIEIDSKNNSLVVTRANNELDELLDEITVSNLHHEIFEENDNIGNEVL